MVPSQKASTIPTITTPLSGRFESTINHTCQTRTVHSRIVIKRKKEEKERRKKKKRIERIRRREKERK